MKMGRTDGPLLALQQCLLPILNSNAVMLMQSVITSIATKFT